MRGWSAVEGAFDGKSAALEYVGVDHGGADILMPEQFLNGTNIVAVLEEMGCKGMTEGVAGDAFSDADFFGSFLDAAL